LLYVFVSRKDAVSVAAALNRLQAQRIVHADASDAP
jgi:hypothetical protein